LIGLVVRNNHFNSNQVLTFIPVIIGFLLGFLIDQDIMFRAVLVALLIIPILFTNRKYTFKIVVISTFTSLLTIQDFKEPNNDLVSRQKKYSDKVVYTGFSRQNKVDITTWRGNYWYYINNQNRLSSLDEYLYHEPFVHPALQLNKDIRKVLVLGGETGGVLRELIKYETISKIEVIPLDDDLMDLFIENTILAQVSDGAWEEKRINVINQPIFHYLTSSKKQYDVIFADLPDPANLLHNQFYTLEFYKLCKELLTDEGLMVTQAGSPYFATKAFYSIVNTVESAGFETIPYHNQILTLGEWGWVMGVKNLRNNERLDELTFTDVPVKWINNDAMQMMLSFGKIRIDTTQTGINEIKNPITYKYYQAGNWAF